MVYLFLYDDFVMGGIETLMGRMSTWLIRNNHRVILLIPKQTPAVGDLLPPGVLVLTMEPSFGRLRSAGERYVARWMSCALRDELLDYIIVFSPQLLWLAICIAAATPDRNVGVLAGVWWPGVYSSRGLRGWLGSPESYVFQKRMTPASRLFMSSEMKASLESRCGQNIDGIIWPLPVDGERYRSITRSPVKGRIVSIGRLADAKTYNIWMIDVIEALLREGRDVHWDVYGEGPFRAPMQQRITSLGLSSRIYLHGTLPYPQFGTALANAYAFVGMGTAIIEAAFCQLPGIVAAAYQPDPYSHGYFHEMPGFACGEPLERPKIKVKELISRLLDLDAVAYRSEQVKALEHAQKFALQPLMREFVRHLDENGANMSIRKPTALWVTSKIAKRLAYFFRR